jgi:hypothetical protein
MNAQDTIRGWQIHHHEKLIYQANAGTPTVRLKFYQYPPYRQTVTITKFPEKCHLKMKGYNHYFLFHHKVGTKGIISLERSITVHPLPSFHSIPDNWGNISDFPQRLQQKYQQRSQYWPLHTQALPHITDQEWFRTDDLSTWVQSASRYIKEHIKHPEKQEKRLGAEEAILTGSGDCDEFTDLFVTFARMRGIPCRRLTGYFITHHQGSRAEAHAWGEILSPLKGWIPVDIPLNNLGHHTVNYVIRKIEEFNPALSDYQIQTSQSGTVHYHWELPTPDVTPIY